MRGLAGLLALGALGAAVMMLPGCQSFQRASLPVAESIFRAGLFRLPTDEKVVVLTIDDAPSPTTPAILDLLKEQEAGATFFIHSRQITEETKAAMEAIVAAGHDIAHHGPEDAPAWRMSEEAFATAFAETHETLSAFDTHRRYYRPAHGLYRTGTMDESLRAHGYDPLREGRRYVLASYLPWDAGRATRTGDVGKNARAARRYGRQMAEGLFPGAIVVFHDGWPEGDPQRAEATLISLAVFLQGAEERGYRVVSLSEGLANASSYVTGPEAPSSR